MQAGRREAKTRWAHREAGRLLAAYVFGVPIAAISQPLKGFFEATFYTRHAGDFNVMQLSQGLSPQLFERVSLSSPCILCLLSLMRFLNCVCAVDRQGLARLGVLIGYRLLKRHSRGYSAMVNALLEEAEEWTKRGKGLKTSQKNSAYETDFDVATIFAALELETRRIADAKAIAGAP